MEFAIARGNHSTMPQGFVEGHSDGFPASTLLCALKLVLLTRLLCPSLEIQQATAATTMQMLWIHGSSPPRMFDIVARGHKGGR